jgi:hypothetical protein
MDGPSRHLTWRELACINRRRVQGRPVAWRGIEPGAVVAEYPLGPCSSISCGSRPVGE